MKALMSPMPHAARALRAVAFALGAQFTNLVAASMLWAAKRARVLAVRARRGAPARNPRNEAPPVRGRASHWVSDIGRTTTVFSHRAEGLSPERSFTNRE